MIIALATVSGFQNGIRNKVLGTSGHIVVDDISNVEGSVPVPLSASYESLIQRIKTVPEVKSVQTCLQRPFIAKGETEIEGMIAKGVDNTYDLGFYRENLISGTIPDFSKDSNQVMISQTTADRLGLKTGDKFRGLFFISDSAGDQRVKAINPRISGIFSTGLEEFDKSFVITSRKVLKRMLPPEQSFTQWEVLLHDYNKSDQVAYQIMQSLPAGKFNVNTARRYNRQIFDWLGLLDTNVVIILFLMILVACINMCTTLLIMITERTSMVGILKALGAGNRKISSIFLYNGMFIALGGILLGNIAGYGFCLLQQRYKWITLNEETYYVDHVLIDVQFWHIPAVNLGTLLLCTLVLLLPLLLIYRLSPLKSIRFQ